MANEDLLLYVRRASRRQVATAVVVAILLFAVFLATLPFSRVPLPQYNAIVPVIDTVLTLGDGITAAILFSQAAILRSRALTVLATGFLFQAIIIVPHALTFPGAFTPQGLLSSKVSTTGWLYLFWHLALPIAVIAYAILQRMPESPHVQQRPMRRTVAYAIAGSLVVAVLLTWLTIAGHNVLPPIMRDSLQISQAFTSKAAGGVALLLAAAIILVARGRRSLVDVWLLVTMWAWMLEMFLIMAITERYSLGWYSGRISGMFSGIFVLLALLIESNRLYTQLARSAMSEQQQREGRLMSLDAAAAAIAHEVKQPITAMVTNASAALIRVEKDPPDLPKVAHALRLIVDDGHRAADTIADIRALFGRQEAGDELVDLNQLVRETLALRAVELASRGIVTIDDLASDLPLLAVRPLQMRQVLVNLINNAIEALGERPAGPRRIVVRSAPADGGGVAIDVGDSGRGIPSDRTERIFDAFYTTKTYGTGMGLPLCRSIVEGHGGKLSVTSVEGQGTTFHIHLPGPHG